MLHSPIKFQQHLCEFGNVGEDRSGHSKFNKAAQSHSPAKEKLVLDPYFPISFKASAFNHCMC